MCAPGDPRPDRMPGATGPSPTLWRPLGSTAMLTEDMQRVVREQRLGFYATVCADGSPNLSPKGTTIALDDDRLFFAAVRSPPTPANIRGGSLDEVNTVDPLARKGYRFKGPAETHKPGG